MISFIFMRVFNTTSAFCRFWCLCKNVKSVNSVGQSVTGHQSQSTGHQSQSAISAAMQAMRGNCMPKQSEAGELRIPRDSESDSR